MKTKKEIKKTLEDCKNAISECEKAENFNDALRYEGWVEALEYVLKGSETKEVPEDEEIIRSWSNGDVYVATVKKTIRDLEYSISKVNGVSGISGGYCIINIHDLSTDVFNDSDDWKTEEEIDNFHLDITFGVKSDCDDWSTTYYERLNCETLKLISEEEK